MIKCTEFLNDYDVQMILADNYMKLERWAQAENYYIIAHNMTHNKFIPLYRLMLLYEYTKEEDKLLEIANVIIRKTVKVPSVTVSQINSKAQNIIDS